MDGWIKLHRDIQTHWIWKDKPFDKRSAWIDLLLLANYRDFKTVRKGKIAVRKRGEVNTSVTFLAERWGWSRNKVYRFLELLESDGMLNANGTTDGTTLTVENYDKWQPDETADGTTNETTGETTDGTTDGTHDKKDKNIKKIKNSNSNKGYCAQKRFTPPTLEEVASYINERGYQINAERFIDYYEANGWLVGRNKMKDWKAAIRNWERRRKENYGIHNDTSGSSKERGGVAGTVSGSEGELSCFEDGTPITPFKRA